MPRYLPWLSLGAIFFTYVNIGAYWTYIELASVTGGIDPDWVGRLLVIVSLGSFVGCLVAVLISNRWGLARPLLATLALMAVIVGILGVDMNYTNLFVSLCLFNLLWVFIDVYQIGTVAVIDRRGAFAALMPGAQGLGQIVGPNAAASLLEAGSGYDAVFFMCAAAALVGLFIYAVMYLWLRRRIPLLADVS
ncbi:MAG: YbfB/YjiJ family MFS transporter [Gammaproteobacteria bacterium]